MANSSMDRICVGKYVKNIIRNKMKIDFALGPVERQL
jgi:hypothetical protein